MSVKNSREAGFESPPSSPERLVVDEGSAIVRWVLSGELDEESLVVDSSLARVILDDFRAKHRDEHDSFNLTSDAVRRHVLLEADTYSTNSVRLIRENIPEEIPEPEEAELIVTAEQLAMSSVLGSIIVEFVMSHGTISDADWEEIESGNPPGILQLLTALQTLATDPIATQKLLLVAETANLKLDKKKKTENIAFIKEGRMGYGRGKKS